MFGWLEAFYLQFWYHTEFWLTPVNRRPYTFIMRDWMFKHQIASLVIVLVWFAGMIALSCWHGTLATVLSILTAAVTAHLVWGSAYIENQQEDPTYTEEEVDA